MSLWNFSIAWNSSCELARFFYMAAASDYSYLECAPSSSSTSYSKGNCSASELYDTCTGGRTIHNNMGVLVTAPWPMSHEPVYDRPSSTVSVSLSSACSRRSMRESKDCSNCHHHQSEHQQTHMQPNSHHHNYIQQNQSLNQIHSQIGNCSMRNVRPFSVPPSVGMMSGAGCRHSNSSIADANHLEMMSMSSNSQAPAIPSRAMLNDIHHPSPPTCVPWLKKMKVIKKLQRKIGIG